MHSREYLIENKILDESKVYSRTYIAKFYQNQLDKFEKIGLGRPTENETIVTQSLINITRERLYQLKPFLRITEDKENNNDDENNK